MELGTWLETKLALLTERARRSPEYKFISLAYMLNEELLLKSFWELKRDKASGIDGVTVEEYEVGVEDRIRELVGRLKADKYRPKPFRRVYIPKPEGGKRPLGIPALEDKIVQMGIKKLLEPIFEVDFKDVSYGFRPNRNCHQALDVLDKAIMTKPINYVVEVDIERFFDNIDHEELIDCLRKRIKDSSLLRIVGHFLKSGIMEEGKYIETDKGTPQGGILSPLLANIYLHNILDLWFEEEVRPQLKGYAQLIRYADDFVVVFQAEREARWFVERLKERLSKFGLKLKEEKTKVIAFGRYVWEKAQKEGKKVVTFEFLGFTHYCDKTRRGKFKLGKKTSRKRYWEKVKGANQWLKEVRNQVGLSEWWKVLGQKLIGHYRYYGVSGNMPGLRAFRKELSKLAYKWINRRSQKKSYTFQQYCRFKKYNPLPEPKIYHLTYTLSSLRGGLTEEPCMGNP